MRVSCECRWYRHHQTWYLFLGVGLEGAGVEFNGGFIVAGRKGIVSILLGTLYSPNNLERFPRRREVRIKAQRLRKVRCRMVQ